MHNPLSDGSKGRFVCAFLAGICLVNLESQAAELVLSGFYQGKNLFVQNPLSTDRQSFCTQEVYLNDQKVMSGIRASAYEIDLSALQSNDAVKVRIVHGEGCAPKVLNPQVLRSTAVAFQFLSFTVSKDAIRWDTSGEGPNSMYFVEQFISNNWLAIKTIYSKNTARSGTYSVAPAHNAGVNRYRVKVQDQEGKVLYTREVSFSSAQETVTFYPKSVTDKITLSRAVSYEVRNVKQKTVKRGTGKEIALKELKTGVYYLLIDSRTEKFFKK